VKDPRGKPRVFVGSSTEGLPLRSLFNSGLSRPQNALSGLSQLSHQDRPPSKALWMFQ
jgi:hypothetical protein